MMRKSFAGISACLLFAASVPAGWCYCPQTPLTSDASSSLGPFWSPYGDAIGFVRAGQILKIPPGGGPETALTTGSQTISLSHWSPDGQWVVYEGGTLVKKVPAGGGAETTILNFGVDDLCWSPDGSLLYYASGGQVGKVSSAGGGTPVVLVPEQAHDISLSYDGNWLAYAHTDYSGPISYQIRKIKTDGTSDTLLASYTSMTPGEPFWSPDDSWVYFENSTQNLYRVSSVGGTPQDVGLAGSDWRFSHIENRLFFLNDNRVWRSALDGSSSEILTDRTGTRGHLTLSPDDQWVAYAWQSTGGQPYQIYKLPAAPCVPTPTATRTATPTATPTITPTPDNGWVKAEATDIVSGMLLYGDKASSTRDMAGLPAFASAATKQFLPHYVSNATWYTGITVANASSSQADVTVKAFDRHAGLLDTATFSLPAGGKVSKLTSSLFTNAPTGNGYIVVTSNQPVCVFELFGDQCSGGIAALPSAMLASTSQVLPHFAQSSRWWTGASILNVGAVATSVHIQAFDASGALIQDSFADLSPGQRWLSTVEGSLNLTANKTGWLLVDSPASPVVSMVIYGDKVAVPNRIAALSGMQGSKNLNLSLFRSNASWWTGISVVNPSSSSTANLTMTARKPDGTQIAQSTQSLAPLSKIVGYVSSLFSLGGVTVGCVEIASDIPVVGFELLNADDAANSQWGLAAVEAQELALVKAQKSGAYWLYLPHFIANARWWTLFGLANPGSIEITGNFHAFTNAGLERSSPAFSIPAKGSLSGKATDLIMW